MNQESGRPKDYEQQTEPLEVFGYRRFESAQDFPNPPLSTNPRIHSTLDYFQPNKTDDWVDGFLKNHNDNDNGFEELPGTFVGMATTLSPSERNQILEEPQIFSDGQDPFQSRRSGPPSQFLKQPFSYPYNELHQGSTQVNRGRSALGAPQTFEQFYDTSNNAFDDMSPITQNPNYFPTPPVSTHMPNFWGNINDLGGLPRTTQTPRRLQFGSDVRFEGPGFMAPPGQETEEVLLQRRIAPLQCLKPEESPASTHPPSPIQQKRKLGQTQHSSHAAGLRRQPTNQSPSTSQTFNAYEDTDPSPKRRRKAALEDDPDFEESFSTLRTHSKRTKAFSGQNNIPVRQNPATTSRGANPRSRQGSVKNNRQCLTEEQKKNNHIISEQKRRDLIKRGYEGIEILVPALRGTKSSKGAMLESAANWLDDILSCNDSLRRQLDHMKRGT